MIDFKFRLSEFSKFHLTQLFTTFHIILGPNLDQKEATFWVPGLQKRKDSRTFPGPSVRPLTRLRIVTFMFRNTSNYLFASKKSFSTQTQIKNKTFKLQKCCFLWKSGSDYEIPAPRIG